MNEFFMETLRQDIDTIKKQLTRQVELTDELLEHVKSLTATKPKPTKAKEGANNV